MRHQPLDVEAVRDFAARRGIDSVSELARRAGLTQSHLNRILLRQRPAMPSTVVALADVLDVTMDEILSANVAEAGQVAS